MNDKALLVALAARTDAGLGVLIDALISTGAVDKDVLSQKLHAAIRETENAVNGEIIKSVFVSMLSIVDADSLSPDKVN